MQTYPEDNLLEKKSGFSSAVSTVFKSQSLWPLDIVENK